MSVSNYEITKKRTAEIFLSYDQEAMIRRRHLDYDQDYLYLTFFYQPHRICRSTGLVEAGTDTGWEEVSFNPAMTIYDYLGYGKETALCSGIFVPLSGLNAVQAGTRQTTLGGGFFDRLSDAFDKNTQALSEACRKIGGAPAGKGDLAWEFLLLEDFPLRMSFWNSDEDFPPQITWFLDQNAAQFMHFETMWYAISHVTDVLMQTAGLPMPRRT